MKTVNVHEAKTHLSRLLERAHRGEEIIIAKLGKLFARWSLSRISKSVYPDGIRKRYRNPFIMNCRKKSWRLGIHESAFRHLHTLMVMVRTNMVIDIS